MAKCIHGLDPRASFWSMAVLCRFGFFRRFRNTGAVCPAKAAEDSRTPKAGARVQAMDAFRHALNTYWGRGPERAFLLTDYLRPSYAMRERIPITLYLRWFLL